MDLGVYAAVYRTNPNSGCPKRHGSIPANHELQESRAARSGHRKPATGVPKNGAPCCEFQGFFFGHLQFKILVCTHWFDHCCFSPPKLVFSHVFFPWPSSPRHPPSHAEGHHQQSNLRGRTQSNAQRKVHLVLQSHVHLGAGPLDHSWNMNSSLG